MNRKMIQLNENCGVVSDKEGNLRIVKIKNNEYSLEDILRKENELEGLRLELIRLKNNQDIIEESLVRGKIIDIVMLVEVIAASVCVCFIGASVEVLMIAIGAFYAIFKSQSIKVSKKYKKEIEETITTIEDLEGQEKEVEEELRKMKEKTGYIILNQTEDGVDTTEGYGYNNILGFVGEDVDNNINKQDTGKVLTLTRNI